MKYTIKNQHLFCLFISSLLFFSGCAGNESNNNGNESNNGDKSHKQRGRSHSDRKFSCPEAGLSEEQKAQIKEIRQNLRDSNHGLSREERQTNKAELQKTILETIPETEEQRAALEQCFEHRREKSQKP